MIGKISNKNTIYCSKFFLHSKLMLELNDLFGEKKIISEKLNVFIS